MNLCESLCLSVLDFFFYTVIMRWFDPIHCKSGGHPNTIVKMEGNEIHTYIHTCQPKRRKADEKSKKQKAKHKKQKAKRKMHENPNNEYRTLFFYTVIVRWFIQSTANLKAIKMVGNAMCIRQKSKKAIKNLKQKAIARENTRTRATKTPCSYWRENFRIFNSSIWETMSYERIVLI